LRLSGVASAATLRAAETLMYKANQHNDLGE
jgi:hypothetical protein